MAIFHAPSRQKPCRDDIITVQGNSLARRGARDPAGHAKRKSAQSEGARGGIAWDGFIHHSLSG